MTIVNKASEILKRWLAPKKPIHCHYPYSSVFVTMDGAVRPCCFALPVGNLNDQTMEEIWNGAPMQAMRASLLAGDMEQAGCATCGFRGRRDIETYPHHANEGQGEVVSKNIIQQEREYAQAATQLATSPSHLVLQVTDACNYRCEMCFQEHDPEPLPDQIFDRALASMEKYDEIQFTGGEPFLSTRVQKFLKEFDPSSGQKLSFTTNGSLLHKYRRELERLPRLHLGISLDAATDATYRSIRKGGDFEQVIDNVTWFADQRKARDPLWESGRVAFVIMKSNYKEIGQFIQMAKEWQLPVMFAPIWGEFAPGENIFSHPELRDGLLAPKQVIGEAEEILGDVTGRMHDETLKSLKESLSTL